jgi:hypothetical protein
LIGHERLLRMDNEWLILVRKMETTLSFGLIIGAALAFTIWNEPGCGTLLTYFECAACSSAATERKMRPCRRKIGFSGSGSLKLARGRLLLQHTNEFAHPGWMVGPGARRNHHSINYRLGVDELRTYRLDIWFLLRVCSSAPALQYSCGREH